MMSLWERMNRRKIKMIKVNHYQKAAPQYIHEKKKETAKKMSPLGKLKAMVDDNPSTLAGHLEWFKKHGTPK
jgi:hypothetical protein